MTGPSGEGAHKRVQRSVATVLEHTYALLSEAGIARLSVDEVSRRSGVAKTTIYRHWPSRSALLLDACTKLSVPVDPPDTGDLAQDLGLLAQGLAAQLSAAPWASILPSIIDAAERDPEVSKVHAALQAQFNAPFLAVVERARARGALARDETPAEVVAAVLGPLYFRRWFSKEPIDPAFVATVVRRAIR